MLNLNKQKLLLWITKIKIRFDRGYFWFKYIRDFAILLVALKQFDIPIWVSPLFIPFMYFLGYFDEMSGIWKIEARYGAETITKFKRKLFKR